jgi:hypothetical protein
MCRRAASRKVAFRPGRSRPVRGASSSGLARRRPPRAAPSGRNPVERRGVAPGVKSHGSTKAPAEKSTSGWSAASDPWRTETRVRSTKSVPIGHVLGRALVLLGLIVTACGGVTTGSSGGGAAESDLRQAVDSTIGAGSLRVDAVGTFAGIESTTTNEYKAPDRIRTRVVSPGHTTEIVGIGADFYATTPSDPGTFSKVIGNKKDISTTEKAIRVLGTMKEAYDVRLEAGAYRFKVPAGGKGGKPDEGKATISEGRLATLEISGGQGEEAFSWTYVFSMFDSIPPIEAPRADQIIEDPATSPTCSPESSPVCILNP